MAVFGWSWVAGFVLWASAFSEDGDPVGGVEAPNGKVGTFEWVEGGAK